MSNKKIRIDLSSPPDRKKLVADICVDGCQLAEINQEKKKLSIEIYNNPKGICWKLDLAELEEAIRNCKKDLLDYQIFGCK